MKPSLIWYVSHWSARILSFHSPVNPSSDLTYAAERYAPSVSAGTQDDTIKGQMGVTGVNSPLVTLTVPGRLIGRRDQDSMVGLPAW